MASKKNDGNAIAWTLAILASAVIFGIFYLISDKVDRHNSQEIADLIAMMDKDSRMSEESIDSTSSTAPNNAPESPSNSAPRTIKKSSSKSPSSSSNGAWSYKGSEGPEYWGGISSAYEKCQSGKKQSPVNIEDFKQSTKLLPLKFVYRNSEISLHNNGHTIQGNYAPGSHIEIQGDTYNLLQFHFHTPSEHQMTGIQYDVEIHFVHKDENGRIAYVGLFVEEGMANSSLEKIWKDLPMHKGDRAAANELNIEDILPKERSYYHYMGSITTPPCTENVRWYLLKQSIEMSANQIDRLVRLLRFNARPTQNLNGRIILRSTR